MDTAATKAANLRKGTAQNYTGWADLKVGFYLAGLVTDGLCRFLW
jgi:hypothetical protein